MIVAVKRNKKQKFIKFLSLVLLVGMFAAYYYYMSKNFEEQQQKDLEAKQAIEFEKNKKEENKKNLERTILTEIEKAVDLIGQEYIRHVKIIEEKVVIICEPNTNLEALIVRYGAMALVKNTLNEIIIAIDINLILKSKLNEK